MVDGFPVELLDAVHVRQPIDNSGGQDQLAAAARPALVQLDNKRVPVTAGVGGRRGMQFYSIFGQFLTRETANFSGRRAVASEIAVQCFAGIVTIMPGIEH
jgi:hypothetical protein